MIIWPDSLAYKTDAFLIGKFSNVPFSIVTLLFSYAATSVTPCVGVVTFSAQLHSYALMILTEPLPVIVTFAPPAAWTPIVSCET